jgi:hypothetical protein
MNTDLILGLYNRTETVFTVDEISQLFPTISYESLRDRLYYFTKAKKLKRLHYGIYAKEKYDPYELANKVYKPSYISLETVLEKEGIVFQRYKRIFVASYVTRVIEIDKVNIQYRQIRKDLLTNTEGIFSKTGYFIASPERAFLDAIYIYKNYHFDNLGTINWEKVNNLKQIYKSKIFEKRVVEYYELYRQDYGKN